MSNYHGLSEREANELLGQWYFSSTGRRGNVGNDLVSIFSEEMSYRWFTRDLNAVALLEQALDEEQQCEYGWNLHDTAFVNGERHSPLYKVRYRTATADAPTRVRALLQVLGLTQQEKGN